MMRKGKTKEETGRETERKPHKQNEHIKTQQQMLYMHEHTWDGFPCIERLPLKTAINIHTLW